MATTIITRFTGKCADCGSEIPVGAQARYYGRGTLYGLTCHEQNPRTPEMAHARGGHDSGPRKDCEPCHTPIEAARTAYVKTRQTKGPKAAHTAALRAAQKAGANGSGWDVATQVQDEIDPEPTKPAHDIVEWRRPVCLTPGKDHRRTSGKATFSGKGLNSKCGSTAYWGKDIWTASDTDIMAARSIGTMLQAVGFKAGMWTRGSNPFVSYPARLIGAAFPKIVKGSTDQRIAARAA